MLQVFCVTLYVLAGMLTFIATMIFAPIVRRRVDSWSMIYGILDYEMPGPYLLFGLVWPIGFVILGMWIFMAVIGKFTSRATDKLEEIISYWEKRV